MDRIQLLHRIGACENNLAQPNWKGPAIPLCSAPATYLCQVCGRVLCGSHAGGHTHAAADSASALASHFQNQLAQQQTIAGHLSDQLDLLSSKLEAAHSDQNKLAQIRSLVA